eukprot:symbB.v1.2.006587.t1/scaffold387.1/size215482/10
MPHVITDPSDFSQDNKRRKVEFEENPEVVLDDGASPSIAPANEPSEELPDIAMPEAGDSIPEVPGPSEGQPPDSTDEGMPPVEEAINTPVPEPGEDELFVKQEKTKKKTPNTEYVFEVGIDVYPEDVTDNELFLWGVLEECFQVNTPKAKQRRVEVSFRKLNESDKELFRQAMKKEWQSWIDNKVVSLCKARGISPDRIIKARWVLVWKKSSDPDVKTKTPKARLVLVGWQDPELGRVATDSPTLRKETKSLVLSVCAAQRWTLWGADIKTAFLSGDASCRDIFFKPPVEVQEWMSLSSQDLMRLEKAAYGLAEAPRAWYLRLCREMKETGLQQSKLDPCLFTLRSKSGELEGICGIHVDDLLGEDELFVKQEKTKKKNPNTEYVFEVGIDVYPEDVTDNELFLWGVLEECFQVNTPKAKQRRVEVSFRKLNESDKELFRQAMKKEWQSWIDNKVVSLCKARGISPDRIIKARWVLVWKKSSDPDVKTKTPKARLVLVGWQDPELGRVATDSPTLRKETKSLVLSVCAAQRWTLWGADIKTAFLSGDASCRDIFFKPPVEVQEWMSLSSQDLMRLEKAAYGLAEAPRAWYLRLCREMKETGLQQSKLDPCLFTLRSKSGELEGICGIHVDDLLGSMPALTESELIMVTKMIYRAAKHGQLEMVMGLLRQSPGEKHLIDEVSAKVGAMSDATKRRRDGDEEPTGSSRGDPDLAFENWCHDMVASGNLDWECVSQLSGFSEESCVTTPKSYMPANVPKAKAKSRFDVVRTGPVPDKYKPENIPNAKAWSTVLCKLPKVEDLKLSYGELVELAETDEDIRTSGMESPASGIAMHRSFMQWA